MAADDRFREQYTTLTNDELLRVLADRDSLTDEAKEAVSGEAARRRLCGNPDAEQRVIELRAIAKTEYEHYGQRMNRWWRLGIFMALGFGFVIVWGVVIGLLGAGNPASGKLAEAVTVVWLKSNLAAWAFSNVFPSVWFTAKRTWLIGFLLNLAAFLIIFGLILSK